MIDTDKYEGHTPGPWVALHRYWPKKGFHGGGLREEGSDEAGNYAESHIYTEAYAYAENGETYNIPSTDWDSICGGVCIEDMATANLVADAPLLLAEIKRLHKNKSAIEQKLNEKGDEGEAILEANPNGHYKEDELRGWGEALEFVLSLMNMKGRMNYD